MVHFFFLERKAIFLEKKRLPLSGVVRLIKVVKRMYPCLDTYDRKQNRTTKEGGRQKEGQQRRKEEGKRCVCVRKREREGGQKGKKGTLHHVPEAMC
jgi:hypothetical protein